MNIRDMENEDGELRGHIEIVAYDHALDDSRRIWRFAVTTGQGGKHVSVMWERGDVLLFHDDAAILSVVAARLWSMGRAAGATLADGRAFADVSSDVLWKDSP